MEIMKIIESWEDYKDNVYAIVEYSEEERRKYNNKVYEAVWLDDGELNSFAGTVGYRIAEFDSIEEAQDFLLKGRSGEAAKPDIWWDMLAV
jgi:hypothetical protein